MKLFLVAILMIVILGIVVGGYAIYHALYIKASEPPAPIVLNYRDGYWRDRYIFSFAQSETSMQEVVDNFMVVMDYEGDYVNYEMSSGPSFNYIYQLSENEIYYYLRPPRGADPEIVPEARIWNFQTGATRTILEGINIQGHHEFLIEDGYFVTLRRIEKCGLDTIVHLEPETGNEKWIWNSEPFFQEKPCSLCPDDDWTHSNDVTVSLDGRYYYVNFRNADSFAKINRETRELIWIAGRNGNFTLLENGVEKESLWYHSHIIKEIKPNVFIMFDNDFHNRTHLDTYPTGEDPYSVNYGGQSRLIEITLDESDMTAEITWSYTPEIEYFSAVFGDIDLLPNGNILGVFGTPVHKWNMDHEEIEKPFGAAILEVSPDAELVREYRFPVGVSIYRVQQLSEDPTDFVGSWLLVLP